MACTPLFVALIGKLARRLPLTGRLALRDSARNRSRTAPAVAAILAAVAGSTAVAVILATNDARDRAQYHSTLRPGQVGLFFNGSTLDTGSDPDVPSGAGLGGFNGPSPQEDKPVDAAKARPTPARVARVANATVNVAITTQPARTSSAPATSYWRNT